MSETKDKTVLERKTKAELAQRILGYRKAMKQMVEDRDTWKAAHGQLNEQLERTVKERDDLQLEVLGLTEKNEGLDNALKSTQFKLASMEERAKDYKQWWEKAVEQKHRYERRITKLTKALKHVAIED